TNDCSQLNLAAADVEFLLVRRTDDVADGALRRIIGYKSNSLDRLANPLRRRERLHRRRLGRNVDEPGLEPRCINVELLRDDVYAANREHAIGNECRLWRLRRPGGRSSC